MRLGGRERDVRLVFERLFSSAYSAFTIFFYLLSRVRSDSKTRFGARNLHILTFVATSFCLRNFTTAF